MTQGLFPGMPDARGYIRTAASISDCGRYRYELVRVWDAALPVCVFVMLNPSTADALEDDPTIRRCVGFAKLWGFGALVVVNLYAYRATDPDELAEKRRAGIDVIGPRNDEILETNAAIAGRIVAGWGKNADPLRAEHVLRILELHGDVWRIGEANKDGTPKHPLYLRESLPPLRFRSAKVGR